MVRIGFFLGYLVPGLGDFLPIFSSLQRLMISLWRMSLSVFIFAINFLYLFTSASSSAEDLSMDRSTDWYLTMGLETMLSNLDQGSIPEVQSVVSSSCMDLKMEGSSVVLLFLISLRLLSSCESWMAMNLASRYFRSRLETYLFLICIEDYYRKQGSFVFYHGSAVRSRLGCRGGVDRRRDGLLALVWSFVFNVLLLHLCLFLLLFHGLNLLFAPSHTYILIYLLVTVEVHLVDHGDGLAHHQLHLCAHPVQRFDDALRSIGGKFLHGLDILEIVFLKEFQNFDIVVDYLCIRIFIFQYFLGFIDLLGRKGSHQYLQLLDEAFAELSLRALEDFCDCLPFVDDCLHLSAKEHIVVARSLVVAVHGEEFKRFNEPVDGAFLVRDVGLAEADFAEQAVGLAVFVEADVLDGVVAVDLTILAASGAGVILTFHCY